MSKIRTLLSNRIYPSDPSTGKLGCMDYNFSMLHWVGVPIFSNPREFRLSILLYGILLWTLIRVPHQVFEINDLIHSSGDIGDLTQNLCMSSLHFGSTVKIILIQSRIGELRKILKQFRFMSMKYVRTVKQKEAFFKMEFENKIILTVYALIVELSTFFGMIMVLLVPADLVGKIFPYRSKMPDFVPLELQKIYIPFAIFLIGFQSVATDFLNVAFMNLTRCQLQMLNMSFEELNEEQVGRVTVEPVRHLNRIIEHHTLILNIRDKIEDLFKYPMLVQFMFSLLIFALTGFQAFFQSNTSGLIMVYLYVGCILAELLVYCWFGTEVSEQNKTLAMRAYESSWYIFNVKYRKSLVIFLMNAQRPFYFTAGGYLELSLSMFGQILSKSYSFVALLRQQYNG